MWHEARKQERKIRGMLVDYRKRAERRQDFYEKIKADPTQFMQVHGRRCKIHLDPAVAAAGESPAIMMPWQGQADNLIDRFDVRAHLDYIPPVAKSTEDEELSSEERQCNYERYRILSQNDFLRIPEEKYLHQLHLEEQFGINAQQMEMDKEKEKAKKKIGGVAIGYNYDDDGSTNDLSYTVPPPQSSNTTGSNSPEDSDSDMDMDVSIDISKIDTSQAHEMNAFGRHYGMVSNDFYSFLTKDAEEAESLRMAREEEQEKIMMCGRKSRRERRAQREKRFAGRTISPPSYAAKEENAAVPFDDEKNDSESRSPSPENSGKITYITSFGGEDELTPHSKISINFNKPTTLGNAIAANFSHINSVSKSSEPISYAEKVKQNLEKLKKMNEGPHELKSPKKPLAYQRRQYSRSRSRGRRSSRRDRRTRNRDRSSSSRSLSRSRSRSTQNRRRGRYRSSSGSSSSSSHSSAASRRRQHARNHRNRSVSSSASSSSTSSKSINTSKSRSSIRKSKSRSPSNHTKSTNADTTNDNILVAPTSIFPTILSALPPPPPPPIQTNETQKIETISPSIVTKQEPLISEQPLVKHAITGTAPVKKYYGRKRDNQSSSEEIDYEDETNDQPNITPENAAPIAVKKTSTLGKTASLHTNVSTSSSSSKSSFNPRDRLKRKMQILLNKQYKADKLAEIEKSERQIQQQQERDDEMRELALRLRRRQRELRHKYGSPAGSQSDNSEKNSDKESKVPEREPKRETRERETKQKSRNRSHSPSTRRSRSKSRSKRRTSRSRSRSRRKRNDSRDRRRYRSKRSNDRSRSRSHSRRNDRRDRNDHRNRSSRDRSRDRNRRTRSKSKSRSQRMNSTHKQYSENRRKLVDY